MRKKLFLEEEEWKSKRFVSRIQTARRSPLVFKTKSTSPNKSTKTTFNYNKPNSTEVVVKITSNSKNLKTLKSHLDYMSRNGNVELLSSDGLTYFGKEAVGEVRDIFRDEGAPIPKKTEIGQREYRETYNMVFSFKDVEKDILLSTVHKTLSDMYPNHYFVVAFHGDTDHSHCHICLKAKDNQTGKRLDIRKDNLLDIRKTFARNLRDVGILATAAKKPKAKHDIINKNNQHHFYEIIGYGKSPYNHEEGNKITGYVKYLTGRGEEKILYGNDIERAVRDSGVKIGEKARLSVKEQISTIIKIKEKNKTTGEIIEHKKIVNKNIWECITLEQHKKQKTILLNDSNEAAKKETQQQAELPTKDIKNTIYHSRN